MKREKYIYITAFLFGVIGTNILASKAWINPACLHHHQLLQLSYSEINYESYLIEILVLRFKTVIILWLLGRVIPMRLIKCMIGGIFCMTFGTILTCAILANGVWGILLFLGFLFPQWIFYISAFRLCGSFYYTNAVEQSRNKSVARVMVLVLIVMLGCILEVYVNPSVLKLVIKY